MTNSRISSNNNTTITTNSEADYNYNNNNNRARAREASPEMLEKIRQSYEDNIGPMTKAAANLIEDAMNAGSFDVDTVILAIEETGLASRPSAYYLRAVLRNWAETGVAFSRLYSRHHKIDARPWWRKP